MDKELVARVLLRASKVISAKNEEITDDLAKEIDKGVNDLKKEIEFKGTDGIAQVSWIVSTRLFHDPILLEAGATVTGRVITQAEDLKKYADAFMKADRAYQDGKKKVEEFARKYGFKVIWK